MKFYRVHAGAVVNVVKTSYGKGSSFSTERLTKDKTFGLDEFLQYDDGENMFIFEVGNLHFYVNANDVESF